VRQLWPLSNQQRKNPPQSSSGSTIKPEMPVHRPAAKEEIVRAARELYRQPGKPPNSLEAEQLLMKQFPGTSRDEFIRPILRAKEFADLRLKRGNQRKV
jgi:hypothetical protein